MAVWMRISTPKAFNAIQTGIEGLIGETNQDPYLLFNAALRLLTSP